MNKLESKTRTTVTLNSTEITLIKEVLKPAEELSSFVHLSVSELIEKRRLEKGLVYQPEYKEE